MRSTPCTGWNNSSRLSLDQVVGEIGEYIPNQLFIALAEDYSIFTDEFDGIEDSLEPENLANFVHEYVHFIHNFSTLAGCKSFILHQKLLALFSIPITSEGDSICLGNVHMSLEEKNAVRNLVALNNAWEGDRIPMLELDETIEDIAITGTTLEYRDFLTDESKTIVVPILTVGLDVKYENAEMESTKFCIGNLAIEEFVANQIELDIIRQSAPEQLKKYEENVPFFPYKVLRLLAKYITPTLSNGDFCCIALASLCTQNPSESLYLACIYIQELINREHTIEDALDKCRDKIAEDIGDVFNIVIQKDIPGIIEMHSERGIGELAIRAVGEIFEHCITARKKNFLFEITPLLSNDLSGEYQKLIASLPFCDIIIERDTDPERIARDAIISLNALFVASGDKGFPLTTVMRPMQAQLHYLKCHLSDDGILPSIASDANQCPFFTCCNTYLRKERAQICATEPWAHYSQNAEKLCWYGAGVASTMGKTKLEDITYEEFEDA